MKSNLVKALSAGVLSWFIASNASAIAVKLELALLIDVSGSVDANEYALQKGGYVQAFQSASIQNLIANTPGGIAVTFIEWSSGGEQQQAVGWTHLTNAATANAFATAVNNDTRSFSGNTAPGSAINFAAPLFNNNGFEGEQKVIDVSGDGDENSGANTATAAANAIAGGINRINGIAIGNVALGNWYAANIQAGTDSFTLRADSFDDFAAALTTKLTFEIGGGNPNRTPDAGSTLLLFSAVLGGLALFQRRKSIN